MRLGRPIGAVMLAGALWWAGMTLLDLATVSPVHWPRLLPHIVVEAIPAATGALSGSLLLFRGRGARVLLTAFLLTLLQAFAASLFAPQLSVSYERTVAESRNN